MKNINNHGFTLIELLLVISIIALLSSIVITNSSESREKARIAAGQKLETQIRNQYYNASFWTFDEGDAVSSSNIILNEVGAVNYSSTDSFNDSNYITLNGDNNYLSLSNSQANNTDLNIANNTNMVLSAWFKTSSSAGGRIISYGQAGHVPGYYIGLYQGNKITFGIGSYGLILNANISQVYNDNKWHHVAVFYNFDEKKVEVFFDGEKAKSFGNFGACGTPRDFYYDMTGCLNQQTQNPTQSFCLGSTPNTTTCQDGINGSIDNAGVFFEI